LKVQKNDFLRLFEAAFQKT